MRQRLGRSSDTGGGGGREDALAASESRLRLAERAGRQGSFDWDVLANVAIYSEQYTVLHGLPPGTRTESFDSWLERVHPEDRERALAHMRAIVSPDAALEIDYRITRPSDGAVRWIAERRELHRDAEGAVIRVVGLQSDVTEQRQVAEALRASEERSRAAALALSNAMVRLMAATEAAKLGIYEYNTTTGRFEIDERVASIWGVSTGEPLSYGRWRDSVHPQDLAPIQAAVARALDPAGPGHFEATYRIRVREGAIRWIHATGRAMTGPEGKPDRIVGALEDVTQRRASEEWQRLLTEAIPQLVWTCDPEGRCDYISPQWLAYTGQTLVEGLGGGWTEVIHPDDRERQLTRWRECVAAGRDYDFEVRLRARDGSYRWFKQRAVPVRDEHGGVTRWFGTSTDITDIVQAREALERADRRKDVFLATLSHELRNPLAPVRTAAELLGRPGLDASQLAWARSVIQRQVRHMAWLLDDLLDLARITQGKLSLKRERLQLAAVVDSAIETVRPLAQGKSQQLVVLLPADDIVLNGDPLRLSQIFSNLLTNASRYTPAGGRIELRARVIEGELVVEVEDTGIGFDQAARANLFEMFAQVRDARQHAEGGLGIGLALVKGLTALHGGSVSAASAGVARGSTFTVRLPLDAATGNQPRGEEARDSDPARTTPARRRVLVVDDNRDAADSIAMLLELGSCEVRVAYDALAALALARDFRPETAILDIGMPEMDGYALARALRAESWSQGMRLIALTGWGQDEHQQRAVEAGFDAHVTKPVAPARLEALIAADAPPASGDAATS